MCGGLDDPFPEVVEATGMSALDIAGYVGLTAAPVGFGISLIASATLLDGRARLLAFGALGLLALIAAMAFSHVFLDLPYRTERRLETAGISLGLVATFFIYLRHTYFPAPQQWINLPATAGLAISLVALLFLLFFV